MDVYVDVSNKISSVIHNALAVKKICLQQKKSFMELTEQRASLQQQNNKLERQSHTLLQRNIFLQKKVEKLEDLNKNYNHIINDLSFNEDNDLTTPHTPENPRRQYQQHSSGICTLEKEETILSNSIVTPPIQKSKRKRKNNNDQRQPSRSVRKKCNTPNNQHHEQPRRSTRKKCNTLKNQKQK